MTDEQQLIQLLTRQHEALMDELVQIFDKLSEIERHTSVTAKVVEDRMPKQ